MLFVGAPAVGVSEIIAVAGAPFKFIVWGVIAIVYPDMDRGGYTERVTGLGV
jgi:hypothetical protein